MSDLVRYKCLIGGEWGEAASGEYFESFNPYTGKPWSLVPRCREADAARAVEAARVAFVGPWRSMKPTARGALMRRLADLIATEAERLAAIEVRDNGKLYAEMASQVRYVPQWYNYFGGLAYKIEGAVLPTDKAEVFNFTRSEPLGVVVAVTPWNSPLLLTAFKVAPALAAGNTIILKPSEYTSASTLEFAALFEKAGFPPGVVNVVTGFGAEVGDALIKHPKVAKVTFTGGERSGRHVYQTAAGGFKPVSLELGGKSPNIVFADARIDNAVRGAIAGIFAASGQTCIAGSRLLVQDRIHNEFMDKLLAFAKTAKLGDPMRSDTQVGPVATLPQHQKILDYIEVAKGEGARCVLGGGRGNGPDCGEGWFVQPTIFDEVSNKMRIAQEEVFGPVLSVIRFRDEEEAIEIANDVLYGLASGVWTEDMRCALRMSERLEAGTVWVNMYRAVSFMSPFGGYKHSGLGRENGQDAVRAFLQTKSVWINMAETVPNPFVLG